MTGRLIERDLFPSLDTDLRPYPGCYLSVETSSGSCNLLVDHGRRFSFRFQNLKHQGTFRVRFGKSSSFIHMDLSRGRTQTLFFLRPTIGGQQVYLSELLLRPVTNSDTGERSTTLSVTYLLSVKDGRYLKVYSTVSLPDFSNPLDKPIPIYLPILSVSLFGPGPTYIMTLVRVGSISSSLEYN